MHADEENTGNPGRSSGSRSPVIRDPTGTHGSDGDGHDTPWDRSLASPSDNRQRYSKRQETRVHDPGTQGHARAPAVSDGGGRDPQCPISEPSKMDEKSLFDTDTCGEGPFGEFRRASRISVSEGVIGEPDGDFYLQCRRQSATLRQFGEIGAALVGAAPGPIVPHILEVLETLEGAVVIGPRAPMGQPPSA